MCGTPPPQLEAQGAAAAAAFFLARIKSCTACSHCRASAGMESDPWRASSVSGRRSVLARRSTKLRVSPTYLTVCVCARTGQDESDVSKAVGGRSGGTDAEEEGARKPANAQVYLVHLRVDTVQLLYAPKLLKVGNDLMVHLARLRLYTKLARTVGKHRRRR